MDRRSAPAARVSVLQLIASPARRGAEVFAVELGGELERRGHAVSTCAVTDSPAAPRLEVPVLGRSAFAPSTLTELRRRAREHDVVVAHGSVTLPASVAALVGSGTRIVYRNIGDPLFWSSSLTRRIRTRALLGRVDQVVALAPETARTLTERFGVDAGRVTVIPNGAPAWRFRPPTGDERSAARRQLGVAEDASVVVSVGALSEEKNVALALASMARLPDAVLVVVGDGPQRAELEANSSDRVQFTGALTDPRSAYHAADVLVLSSATEGLPGVLIEAGLSGLPCVATDVGFVRSVVDDGVSGRVVPAGDEAAMADALRSVLADPGALGQHARERCLTQFSLEHVADAWSALLDERGAC